MRENPGAVKHWDWRVNSKGEDAEAQASTARRRTSPCRQQPQPGWQGGGGRCGLALGVHRVTG